MNKPSTDHPSLSGLLGALSAARDEVRLQTHLLSMDAKKKWDELEAKITQVEGQIGARAETASDTVAERVLEVAESVKRFVDVHLRGGATA